VFCAGGAKEKKLVLFLNWCRDQETWPTLNQGGTEVCHCVRYPSQLMLLVHIIELYVVTDWHREWSHSQTTLIRLGIDDWLHTVASFPGHLVAWERDLHVPFDCVLSSNLGRIANAYGAACVQSVGGVPTDGSR